MYDVDVCPTLLLLFDVLGLVVFNSTVYPCDFHLSPGFQRPPGHQTYNHIVGISPSGIASGDSQFNQLFIGEPATIMHQLHAQPVPQFVQEVGSSILPRSIMTSVVAAYHATEKCLFQIGMIDSWNNIPRTETS